MKYLFIVLCTILSINGALAQQENSHTLTVNITGFSNDKGQAIVGLYNTQKSWLKEPFKGTITKISGKTCQVVFENVPDGVYAVSMYHDVNSDQKLNTNFMGIPSEDYASSRGAKGRFGPPKWNDAKFEIKSAQAITIKL